MLDFDGSRKARRRELAIFAAVLLVALTLRFLPAAFQRSIRQAIRGTVLMPFLSAQEVLASRRASSVDVTALRAQRDSLIAVVSAQATLAEENRRLRELHGLRTRGGEVFVMAEVLRLGIGTAESTFMLNVGTADGVHVNSPVVAPEGLVGIVVEAGEHTSQAIDWTHENFKASGMTADGQAYGMVEPRRGRYREEDLLALTNAGFHADVRPGAPVLTTGRGGVIPRGIPLGVVLSIEEADTGWRKSYLLRPSVRPEAVTHVLVGISSADADFSQLWHNAPADTAPSPRSAAARPAEPPPDTAGRD